MMQANPDMNGGQLLIAPEGIEIRIVEDEQCRTTRS